MPVSARDKKIIFGYLRKAKGGMVFRSILEPEPKPVAMGGGMTIASVKEVESKEADLFEFWEELKHRGLIRPFDEDNREWFVLTQKGKRVAESEDFDLAIPDTEICALIQDEALREIVESPFAAQKFEDAVFKAFKHVEERVRLKAGEPSTSIGATLITEALHHQRGILRVPNCHTVSEEEGVFMLFKGAIQLLKNPSSHRTVDWKDARRAAQAVLLADFLLGLLDGATRR